MDSRRVMKDLSSLRRLRFLSFQGISTIKILSRSVCKLNKLIILDLRYCYNLEQLPDDINKLKNLVYLDLTGCEALESVPARLARLDNLEVLKGFVLGDVDTANTCKLNALKSLENLRKLSVTVHREGYLLDKLIDDIQGFKVLETLKVRWGSKVSLEKKQPNKDETEELEEKKRRWRQSVLESYLQRFPDRERELPTQLRKLDLQRFPDRELPEWLWPQNLINLEKLRLGSSKRLKGFGGLPGEPTKCRVKVLRLTSLLKLKVESVPCPDIWRPKAENKYGSMQNKRLTSQFTNESLIKISMGVKKELLPMKHPKGIRIYIHDLWSQKSEFETSSSVLSPNWSSQMSVS